MDYKSVLFSVEDAGQGLAFSPTAFEESALIDVHDQDVVAVDDIRYAAGVDRVRPGIQVPAKPIRQPARLGDRIPEILECLDLLTPQVNRQLAVFHHPSRVTSRDAATTGQGDRTWPRAGRTVCCEYAVIGRPGVRQVLRLARGKRQLHDPRLSPDGCGDGGRASVVAFSPSCRKALGPVRCTFRFCQMIALDDAALRASGRGHCDRRETERSLEETCDSLCGPGGQWGHRGFSSVGGR